MGNQKPKKSNEEILNEFAEKIVNQEEIPEEIKKIINDSFWELLGK